MPDFIVVTPIADIRSGSCIRFAFVKGAIAVFAVGEGRFAIDDKCMRCGSSLAAGLIQETVVRCMRCNWQYELTTGDVLGVPGLRIETFETRVEGSRLFIAAPTPLTRQPP